MKDKREEAGLGREIEQQSLSRPNRELQSQDYPFEGTVLDRKGQALESLPCWAVIGA